MDKSYRISKIIDKRKNRGRVEYRIRWTGFKASQDTWEPATEIMPVAYRLIRDFHKRSKTPTSSASNSANSSPNSKNKATSVSAEKSDRANEQQEKLPKKSQSPPQRQPKLKALQQLQQEQQQQHQPMQKPKALPKRKIQSHKARRVLAVPQKKAKKRLQKLHPKPMVQRQKNQQAKRKKKPELDAALPAASSSNPSAKAAATAAPSSSSSSSSSSLSAPSEATQPPQQQPTASQASPSSTGPQQPQLEAFQQKQQQQPSSAALPTTSIDWNLKYGPEGGGSSGPPTPRLSPKASALAVVTSVSSQSAANLPHSMPPAPPPSSLASVTPPQPPPQSASPSTASQSQQQQQQQQRLAASSLNQTAPNSSSNDLRRYYSGIVDAIDGIRKLKRKVLVDRVIQSVCKKFRVGVDLAEAVIEDMVRIGRIKKVRCPADNSLTLYLPHQRPRTVTVSTVSVKPKPKAASPNLQQTKKPTHIRNNYHELFVKQPANSPGVLEIWLVGPRAGPGTGQPGCCFTVRLMQELCRALQQAVDNPACRLVRLASTDPRCFSRGVDLGSLLAAKPGQEASLAVNQLTDELQRLVSAMVEFPKLLVATVTGACIGLGAALLPLCDFVYASDSAYFYLPYAQLKQPCEAGTSYTLRQLLGNPTASELLLAGRKLTANEACNRGLVSSVIFADVFQQDAALRCASIGATIGAENVRQTKALMHSASRPSIVQACQAECLALRSYWLRDDARELMRSFLGDGSGLLDWAEAAR